MHFGFELKAEVPSEQVLEAVSDFRIIYSQSPQSPHDAHRH